MKKILTFISVAMFAFGAFAETKKGFYDFVVKTIDGKDFALSSLKGKKVMVVNVASKCGLTRQYAQLQELYAKYGDKNFVIIAFPANNFRGQEPGTNEEILKFCQTKYNVTFPMMAKISVNGDDAAELYKWLTKKSLNGVGDFEVSWNFHKFLINADGTLAKSIAARTSPTCDTVINWINEKQPSQKK